MELVLNLDQTPLSYVSPGKYTFDFRGSKTVPIKGVDDKRQITATFTVTASGSFLPIQLIYSGKTKRKNYSSVKNIRRQKFSSVKNIRHQGKNSSLFTDGFFTDNL